MASFPEIQVIILTVKYNRLPVIDRRSACPAVDRIHKSIINIDLDPRALHCFF